MGEKGRKTVLTSDTSDILYFIQINMLTHSSLYSCPFQGYYYHDAGQHQQQQYAEGSYPPQAYQQHLAYTGVSASQPYWYAPHYEEDGSNPAAQTDISPEVNLALRDRDVKTQRRKEANRESARRSKQRKKEESELLSSKAQELVRESLCLRSELEKIQTQVDMLYNENIELRNQVAKAGGSLPPSPERVVPVKLPPPTELPVSLLKDVGDASNATVEKDQPAPTSPRAETERQAKVGSDECNTQVNAMAAMMRAGDDMLGEGQVDLPSLLENDLTNQEEVNVDQFAQLPLSPTDGSISYPHLDSTSVDAVSNDMLMSEAMVSFREPERDSLFAPSGTLDDDIILTGATFRNPQHFGSSKSLGATVADFSLMRQSDTGQGG